MPSIARILGEAADQAERVAGGSKRAADGVRQLRTEAEALARVRSPSTFAPGAPGGAGGGVTGGVRDPGPAPATGSTVGRGGGGSEGGEGGEGGGQSFRDSEVLVSIDGRQASRRWIETSGLCRRVTMPVPGRAFGETRNVEAWDCGQWGVYIDGDGILSSTRASGKGAGGGGARPARSQGPIGDPFGQGDPYADNGAFGPNFDPYGNKASGEVRAPGVEAELRRTNGLLERVVRGDGGAGFRAEGGLG